MSQIIPSSQKYNPLKPKILSIFWLILLLWQQTLTASHFEYSDLAKRAYKSATSLRLDEAKSFLWELKQNDPQNLIVHHIENYIDCLSILITEDEAAFKSLKENKKKRLSEIEEGDASSPYYLFVQADIRLQWAMVKLKFEEQLGAFVDVSKAFKLLKKNTKLFPDFMPNKKNLALMHTLAGTIPDSFKWGVKLISGIEGDIDQGISEMEEVLAYASQNNFLFEEETFLIYGFLLFHYAEQQQQAWQLLNSRLLPGRNLLHCYILSNIAMRLGKNDIAIQLLQRRPKGTQLHDFPFLDHMLGAAKLRRLDEDAKDYLQKFLKNYKGRNLIKDTYRKLAWHALIFEGEKQYHSYMTACLAKGRASIGDDISALNEAKSGKIPNKNLLQARLLFDGGYYPKALSCLNQLDITTVQKEELRLEYFYRLGRIQQGLKDYQQAFFYYNLTIQSGETQPYFYACNAALQSGKLYEEMKVYSKAREFYERCLKMNPQEYRTSLHTQAKAGLQRIRK